LFTSLQLEYSGLLQANAPRAQPVCWDTTRNRKQT